MNTLPEDGSKCWNANGPDFRILLNSMLCQYFVHCVTLMRVFYALLALGTRGASVCSVAIIRHSNKIKTRCLLARQLL